MTIPEIKVKVTFKKAKPSELHTVKCSKDIFAAAKKVFNKDIIFWNEEMILFCLNEANKIVGYYKISSGGYSKTITDPKIIFTIALNCCACQIILCHNHPSGVLLPSRNDILVTKKIKNAAKLLGILLLDHIIISNDEYFSFADSGKLIL